MRIPYTISQNIQAAYRCSPETLELAEEKERTLRAEDPTWDDNVVPDLKILALRVIASIWKDYPFLKALPTCADKDVLLEILPIDLPLELTIKKLEDGFYWERVAKDRWEFNDPSKHGNSWRQLYCERYLAEYLETLEATYFEPQKEECTKVLNLVKDYIYTLRIRSLMPTRPPWKATDLEEKIIPSKGEDIVNHIPLEFVLAHLPHLVELHLNFGMIYMNDGFEWRDFEFSVEDCVYLGKGIKASPKLRKFSLTRSNADQPRIAAILQGMAMNDNIEELELSHCKLADTGAYAVGEFLSMHRKLKTLHLVNNNVGSSGVAGIVLGILKAESSALTHLDLRMNPLQDDGAYHLCALLVRTKVLETLNISGCGLTSEAGIAMAEVLSSNCVELEALSLDLSNNDLGPIAGELLDVAVQSFPYIIELDVRMCNFMEESQQSINENAYRNKQNLNKERNLTAFYHRRYPTIIAKSKEHLEVELAVAPIDDEDPFAIEISADQQEMMTSILRTRPTRQGIH